ncbi:MAG: hydantoinase B/oxoprolinase family protein [Gammaproteobacteria bacterium]
MAEAVRDPVLMEVIRNELEALAEEMCIAVRRAARSPMVKIGDFAATLCDERGRGIGVGSQNMMTPLFIMQVKRLMQHYGAGIAPGDVYIMNDPYAGGSHLPDVLVVTPMFRHERLAGFAVIYSHHTDMGGRFAGSQSGQCTNAFEEGVRFPLLRLYERGRRNADLVTLLVANVRSPEDCLGDLDAKVAGGWKATQALGAMLDRYGFDAYADCCDHLNELSQRQVREAIRAIPDGDYGAAVELADDGLGPLEQGLPIRVTLRVRADRLQVDFTGTSAQARGGVNMPFENVRGVVVSTLRELLAPDAPLNDGLMDAIEVSSPPGTLTNPNWPAATGGRAPVFFLTDEVLHRALSVAAPERVPVPREAWDVMHLTARTTDGRMGALQDLFSGGWGARPNGDGIDAVAQSSTVTLPVELLEREFPVVVERFEMLADTGGPGCHRGSMGILRRFRYLDEGHVMVRTNRLRPSSGLAGGRPGEVGGNVLNGTPLRRIAFEHFHARPGDVLEHRVAGSGGYGDPFERDPAAVLRDVCEERVSAERALRDYGVAVVADGHVGWRVDAAATAQARRRDRRDAAGAGH